VPRKSQWHKDWEENDYDARLLLKRENKKPKKRQDWEVEDFFYDERRNHRTKKKYKE
jgi:hypothetical protein